MKTNTWWVLLAFVATRLFTATLSAAETAFVKADTVNVRGQPSLFGEVITQLKKGDKVIVLEEITQKKPKPDEPSQWARILMPTNTPVWVNGLFIDTTNGTVKPARLNLRAGAGENYSVVGLLHRGDTVKTIRVVEDWMEIEASTNAYAFVAANLLDKSPVSPAATPVEKTEPSKLASAPKPAVTPEKPLLVAEKPAPVVEKPAPIVEKPAPIVEKPAVDAEKPAPVPEELKPEPQTTAAKEPMVPVPAPAKPIETPQPTPSTPPALVTPPPIVTPPPVAPAQPRVSLPPPKRIVQREGIVRRTFSLLAPTYFELESAQNGATVNYLHTTSTNLVLKNYQGRKILVTGQEVMDMRWPSTPVLEVETLQIAPDATK